MTRKEELYVLNSIQQIRAETHENNVMLKQICQVINNYLRNANKENIDDFGRNVLANVVSGFLNFNKKFK